MPRLRSGLFLCHADWNDGAWLGSEYDNDISNSPWWEIDHVSGTGTLLGSCGVKLSGVAWDANNDIVYGTDGTLRWNNTSALYHIYGSSDPHDGYTFLHTTSNTSWLDPDFPENMKFYYVTSANYAPSTE